MTEIKDKNVGYIKLNKNRAYCETLKNKDKFLIQQKMKQIMRIFGAILLTSAILTSCGGSSTGKKEDTDSQETLQDIADTMKVVENSKNESSNTESSLTSNKVTCIEKETTNEDSGYPILTTTCLYKKYKTISKGYPDYNGRYSYEFSLFKKQENGKYIQIKNALLFNKNKNKLLSIINFKIEKDYKLYSNNPEAKDCFEGASFSPFNFDQLGIYFDDDKINFSVTFGLSDACMSVDGSIVSFNFDEIQKYLNE